MTLRNLICGALLAFIPHGAAAHDAPSGWRYDASCCAGIDCRQIPSKSVLERADGYFIIIGNEVVPYGDKRIRNSPDGFIHWCTVDGRDDSPTICLYVPPHSY
ncbi:MULTISPECIES: hypothetical protein [unclassified Rhizobium]|uniref:hypothetical protein n=1 Tax=unclassified Rhizobium TaxID=2613769 RepID=UPI0006FF2093|nr:MULTISPECIES: hypothetical protein [unclassified Rhizobium]KQV43645.1 hypothetical protein ASC86_02225 [Rhizobium sp. Root1212]KRD37829.1 hypothetical protein ASE37_02225 [Rhizobium sp. Root268]